MNTGTLSDDGAVPRAAGKLAQVTPLAPGGLASSHWQQRDGVSKTESTQASYTVPCASQWGRPRSAAPGLNCG